MIRSRQDYLRYRREDGTLGFSLRRFLYDDIYRYKVTLRKTEYYTNCATSPFGRALSFFYRFRLNRCGRALGFSIPKNVFGPGLSIAHRGTIVVNPAARIGKNCRIHVCVNIGASSGDNKAPRIGDNVYIAPGAKLFGDIQIADGIAIGANAVVNKSFLEPNITIAGVPARKISSKGAAEAGWRPKA